MTDLFLNVVNMSISATWLVLAVLVIRFALKKSPKWIFIILWGIVALRLICPISIESSLSLMPERVSNGQLLSNVGNRYSADTAPIEESNNSFLEATNTVGAPTYSEIGNDAITSQTNDTTSASGNPLLSVLSTLWLVGTATMLLYSGLSFYLLRRKMSEATRYRDNIWQCQDVGSPFVLGIFRPRIYLPYTLSGADMENVLAHEQAHIQRKDHWWKSLGFLLLSIHWFNPLVWLAYILLCRDIELACDEKVIKEMDSQQRADYSQTLLACSTNHRAIVACPLAFGEVGVKPRIKSILHYKKPALWVIVIAVVICIVLGACFLTDPVTDQLAWAKELSSSKIDSARVYVGAEYKDLTADEIEQMVSLIGETRGTPVSRSDTLGGASCYFSITMKDGTSHVFGNDGSDYLVVDGNYYQVDGNWLKDWVEQWMNVDTQPQGDIDTPTDLLDMFFQYGVVLADGVSYEIQADMYVQSALLSYTGALDLTLTGDGFYIGDNLCQLTSLPEGMTIHISESIWDTDDVHDVLDRLPTCEKFYCLGAINASNYFMVVCKLDGVYYFLTTFANGEVMRIHTVPLFSDSIWNIE